MLKVITTVLLACTLASAGEHRIHRSRSEVRKFLRLHGYAHGRYGYVVDHIIPLACGGADKTWNMQFQTVCEGKAKDRWELNCDLARHYAEVIRRAQRNVR